MSIKPSRILAQCPMCQAVYDESAIRLLGSRGASRLFHCSCQTCGHAVLAVVLQTSGWVSSVGVITDLEVADALQFQNMAPLSSNECIQFHQMLIESSEEWCQELEKLQPRS